MPNLVHQNQGTILEWRDSGGDYAMSLQNLDVSGTVPGRQGAVHDFGINARAREFVWRAWFQSATVPVLGEGAEVYAKTGNEITAGSVYDNDDGTTDIDVSSLDKLFNLEQLGTVFVDEAATGIRFSKKGLVWLPDRYFMPIISNKTADRFVNTANLCGFSLAPVPLEIQD